MVPILGNVCLLTLASHLYKFSLKCWSATQEILAVKWAFHIEIEVYQVYILVLLSILRYYSIPEIPDVVLKYQVLWYQIAHHYDLPGLQDQTFQCWCKRHGIYYYMTSNTLIIKYMF